MKTLNQLKDRQIKPDPVRCTCSLKCWCNQLSFRYPENQYSEQCLSPAELLDQYQNQMDNDDIKYLQSLINREFIKP